jgi:hypothetical protein
MGKRKTETAAVKYSRKESEEKYIAAKIAEALTLDEQIKKMKAKLDLIKEEFLERFKKSDTSVDTIVAPTGAAILKTTNSYKVEPEYIPDLMKIFKDNIGDYVVEKVSYGVTAALRRKLSDADYKYADVIRKAVVITTTQSVEFKPPMDAKAKKVAV